MPPIYNPVITIPDRVSVGEIINISGSGFSPSVQLTLKIYAEDNAGGIEIVNYEFDDDFNGMFDLANTLQVAACSPGHIIVEIVADAPPTEVFQRIEVFT